MKFKTIVCLLAVIGCQYAYAQKKKATPIAAPVKEVNGLSDRKFWISEMDKMIRPVLTSLAHDSLKIVMPQIVSKHIDNAEHRKKVAYVEVFGRTLCGIAPWLQLEGGNAEEVALRNQYRQLVLKGINNALDSSAKDFMRFDIGGQQLVDASFWAYGFLRAPWLWEHLDAVNRARLVASFKTTRRFKPAFSNWLLFSGLIETFFCNYGYEWDQMRVDYAMQQMEQWYKGDGMYSDGPSYAFDYYNSFVIHPYLAAITEVINKKGNPYREITEKIKLRNERYAVIQERLINTDGTFPATGRSIVYRGSAFHHLADMAWRKKLPAQLSPAGVRCALTAVIKKTLESPTTYLDNGWLSIGLYGSQPEIGDSYNNTGSLYLCTNIFLPLGLAETDQFWAAPPEQWSAQKIWSGQDFKNDHGMK